MTYKAPLSINTCFLLALRTSTFSLTHALINMTVGDHVLLCTKAQDVKHETLFLPPTQINDRTQA